MPALIDLKMLDRDGLQQFVRGLGWPRYRADQLAQWLYRKGAQTIETMTNLSIADRARLAERAFISQPTLARRQQSSDGTEKFLFQLADGNLIETVLIPDEDRLTLCISTEVGCTLDCGFCLTGTMGLTRHLKAHEIVDQVLWVQRHLGPERPMTNFVFMGMGEPLANYRELIESIRRLTAAWGLAISPRRMTVSTSGMAAQIEKLGRENLGVNLAVSLNATTDAVRDRIMPRVNRAYPLAVLLAACRRFPLPPRRRLTFEYVLLAGVNDTHEDARRLIQIARGLRCKVNLIPYNEYAASPYRRPTDAAVLAFQRILSDAGVDAFIRTSRGRDILAACGQLKTEALPVLAAK